MRDCSRYRAGNEGGSRGGVSGVDHFNGRHVQTRVGQGPVHQDVCRRAQGKRHLFAGKVGHRLHTGSGIDVEIIAVHVGGRDDHAITLDGEVLDHRCPGQGDVDATAGEGLVDLRSVVELDHFQIDALLREVAPVQAVEQGNVNEFDVYVSQADLCGSCRLERHQTQGRAGQAENL